MNPKKYILNFKPKNFLHKKSYIAKEVNKWKSYLIFSLKIKNASFYLKD